eukprot:CAMPEP_0174856250 /NCGR_PEP_ID=MMETSP1114-20130205/35409_1 /TAXON_ID=312471 /ORGANISM="Neobodo designis, Strain CCAP 1951/1" /LENGTH=194 /DNA_ID=CAMNT_0016091037 /DNA_START=31 /DNA_END=615 /DNA_ORIENTATION=+
MAFNCFFGAELTPASPHVAPLPPQSNIVLSQVCVAARSTFTGRMSVCVEGAKKSRVCLATLHPAAGIYHSASQLVFSSSPKFFLEVDRTAVADKRNHRPAIAAPGDTVVADVPATASSAELVAGAAVHITGYYERRDDVLEGQDPDAFAGSGSDSDEDEAPARGTKAPAKKAAVAAKKGADKAARSGAGKKRAQ